MWLLLFPLSLAWVLSLLILCLNCLSTLKRAQDPEQKSKLVAFQLQQLQGQKPKAPGLPCCTLLGGPSSKQWPRNWYLTCYQQGHWKKDCPQRFCQIQHQLKLPHISPQRRVAKWAPAGVSVSLRESSILLIVIPLNSQGEIKIKIHGKPCWFLVDTRLHSLLKLNLLQSLQSRSWENWQKLVKGENPCESAPLGMCSVKSTEGGKISCCLFLYQSRPINYWSFC